MSDLNFRFQGRDLNSPEAGAPPVREVLPKGDYIAKIVDIKSGLTKQQTPQPKMVVEYMILSDVEGVRSFSGKRVFQDYMLNPEVRGDGNDVHTYRLRGLLSACNIPIVNNSFNAQPMIGTDVRITVDHRFGNPGMDGKIPVFTNVKQVDRVASNSENEDIL